MRILLVDDAPSVVKVMSARLERYGHEVIHADNGRAAVERFRELGPDLVLMDVEMPHMNGFDAVRAIRAFEAQQDWAWTPIIFLTSSDTVKNLITAIESGGDDFMSKMAPEPVLNAKMQAMSRIAGLRQKLAQANQKLQRQADHDGLTGLLNRRSMDARLDASWKDARQQGAPFAILMIDIDNFKKYNDHYGHQAGDDCLIRVARAIEDVTIQACAEGLVNTGFAARYGGEEFSITLPGATVAGYAALADRVVAAVRTQELEHACNADWGVVTVSLGGRHVGVAGGPIKALFRDADKQLYEAKQKGRNQASLA